MKNAVARMLVTFAGIALVVPFAAVALFVGANAVAGAESMADDLLLVALAVGGAVASVVKSLSHPADATHNATAFRIASRNHGASQRGTFMNVPS